DLSDSGVSLVVGTLEPCKRVVGLPAKGVDLSDLIRPSSGVLRGKSGQSSIGILFTAERVISHCLDHQFPRLEWFLLNFQKRLFRLSFCDKHSAERKMDMRSLRVQVQRFL